MKELINNIARLCTLVLIFCILFYGFVHTHEVCRSNSSGACIQTFNGISKNYDHEYSRISFWLYVPNHGLPSDPCSKVTAAEFGTGNACCKPNRCDGYKQPMLSNFSIHKISHLLNTNISSSVGGDRRRRTNQSHNSTIFHQSAPIYVLTESIIR